jgi:cell division protein FtsZ
MADDVLYSGVRGVTDLMVMPGLINLDFADIRAIMAEMGKAMMGTGEAEGDRRSIDAAEAAISNPLLDDVSMKGARGVLINITGGPDMTLFEVDEAANRIREEVDPEANIIFGSTFDESLEGRIRISVVATGIDAAAMAQPRPVISLVSDRSRPEPVAPAAPAPAQQPAAMAIGPIAAAAAAMAAAPQPVVAGTSALAVAQAQPQPQAAATQPLPQAQPVVAKPLPQPPVAAPPVVAAAPRAPEAETIERAVVREDAFIPPKPVEPQVRPPVVTAPVGSPDPFAAAAMANGGRGQPAYKMRAPSLFERVTGVGRARSAQAEPVTAAPVAPPQPPAPQPQQPRLGPLDPADRVTVSKGEEDLLEIPAFLRRQAN